MMHTVYVDGRYVGHATDYALVFALAGCYTGFARSVLIETTF